MSGVAASVKPALPPSKDLAISLDLHETNAISPPRPFLAFLGERASAARGASTKMWVTMRRSDGRGELGKWN